MSLEVSAFAVVGDEHAALAKILTQWLDEGFEETGLRVQLAQRLLDELVKRGIDIWQVRA